jgi:hypothetical protein
MAGTLTVGTLSDGTNSGSATDAILGSSKAWVNFKGTGTVSIRADHNVSSITDHGTGDYTITFSTAMPDTNYCVLNGPNGWGGEIFPDFYGTPTTGSVRIRSRREENEALYDVDYIMIAIFR